MLSRHRSRIEFAAAGCRRKRPALSQPGPLHPRADGLSGTRPLAIFEDIEGQRGWVSTIDGGVEPRFLADNTRSGFPLRMGRAGNPSPAAAPGAEFVWRTTEVAPGSSDPNAFVFPAGLARELPSVLHDSRGNV